MARFSGILGINRGPVEVSPGIYKPQIEEIVVTGEIRQEQLSWGQANLREGLRARHVLSIVTPDDGELGFGEVEYIEWQGKKWDVISVAYKRPRLELSMGGIYNG